jgi:hypothetical protein
VPRLKHDAPLTLLGVGAARVREFERRRAPELKVDVHLTTLVNIHARLPAMTDLHAGQRVDRLGQVDSSAALARLVRNARDDELAWLLSNATEVGRGRLCVPPAIEVVGDIERRRSGQRVGDALADAIVLARLQGVDRRRVVQLDEHRRPSDVVLPLAAAGIAHTLNANLLAAEA